MTTELTLLAIAGTDKDFLLSVEVLKTHIGHDPVIGDAYAVHTHHERTFSPNDQGMIDRITEELAAGQPDIIGFSCYIWNFLAVEQIARGLRERGCEATIILGGPEITREEIVGGRFDTWTADYLVFGEGEKPLTSLLRWLRDPTPAGLEEVPGLAFREGDGFRCHAASDRIDDLSVMPSAIMDGSVPEALFDIPGMRINIETQRGCTLRCAYCFYHKGSPTIRYRDPHAVVDELEWATRRGVTVGRLVDANFLSSKERVRVILGGMIERDIRMKLLFEAIAPFVTEEVGELIGDYIRAAPGNSLSVAVGIQSLNATTLKIIRRSIRVSVFETALDVLHRAGAIARVDLILGLPRETKATYLEAIEFVAEKMRDGFNFLNLSVLQLLPNTDMIGIAEREELELDDRAGARYVFATPTLPRKEFVDCLRLNTVAFRLLNSDNETRAAVRDEYFRAVDATGQSHVEALTEWVQRFTDHLRELAPGHDFLNDEYPNAQDYSCRTDDILSDDWLLDQLRAIQSVGEVRSEGRAPQWAASPE